MAAVTKFFVKVHCREKSVLGMLIKSSFVVLEFDVLERHTFLNMSAGCNTSMFVLTCYLHCLHVLSPRLLPLISVLPCRLPVLPGQ